jgi:Uma2 family endonuclease
MSQQVIPNTPSGRWPFAVIWTRDDCAKLEAAGVLDYRYELVEGDIIRKMGQNVLHGQVVILLIEYLLAVFQRDFLLSQTTIDVRPEDNPTNAPEPDATVLSVPVSTLAHPPTAAQIALVAEVSDSTLTFDLTVKANLYARAGISEYWVIDIPNRLLHLHTNPQNGHYQTVTPYPATTTVAPLSSPTASILVSRLLP